MEAGGRRHERVAVLAYFGIYYSEVIANVANILSIGLDEITSGLDVTRRRAT